VILQNNVFIGNQALGFGGAVYLTDSFIQPDGHMATLINNSFYNNTASVWGGAIYSQNVNPLIINSIFWADSAFTGSEIYAEPTDIVEIAYSNINPDFIYGEFLDGGDNINEDPMFEDSGLLTISGASPCINSGTLDFACDCGLIFDAPAYDILGMSRPMNGFNEMGAYEVLMEGVANKPANHENGWYNNFPNPFTAKTYFSYELNDKTFVEINLFTSAGLLIQTLFAETQEAGSHILEFEAGTLPSGIYFYRIATNTQQATGKMILMK
jgi:predicted outer membrane repeat protein